MTPIGGISLFQGEVFFISLMNEVYIQKKEVGIQMEPGVPVTQLIFVCLHNSRLFRFYSQTGEGQAGPEGMVFAVHVHLNRRARTFSAGNPKISIFCFPGLISQIKTTFRILAIASCPGLPFKYRSPAGKVT
jgi:hypothetical protein